MTSIVLIYVLFIHEQHVLMCSPSIVSLAIRSITIGSILKLSQAVCRDVTVSEGLTGDGSSVLATVTYREKTC